MEREDITIQHMATYKLLCSPVQGHTPKIFPIVRFYFCPGCWISGIRYEQQDYSQQTLKIENGRHSEAGTGAATSPFWAGVEEISRHTDAYLSVFEKSSQVLQARPKLAMLSRITLNF